VLLLVALTVATVDLVDKAISPALPDYYHPRPFPVLLVMIAVTVLGSLTFPRAGSRTLAVAGGLMVGGGAANTLSLAFWGEGVPDPLVSYRLGIAFNLADVAVTAGFLLLFPALVVFVLQHRHDLEAEL